MHEISNIGAVRTVVQQLHRRGCTDVVLSPGSRNAPFILSFTSIESFHCQSVLDERTAGFVALGRAQQSQKPVVLSCTSGSAVANYAPAMAEAYYQRIPLVVVTADRPAAWIDQGEGQSIRQVGLLDNVSVDSVNLVEEHSDTDHWFNVRKVSEALETAMRSNQPVHINVPLSEPLYGTQAIDLSSEEGFQVLSPSARIDGTALSELAAHWKASTRILILATNGTDHTRLQSVLSQLSDAPRVAVVTETNANLFQLGFISCIDRTLERFIGGEDEASYVPDLLITIGGNIVSKKLKALLRKHRRGIAQHWHFGPEAVDTFQSLSHVIQAAPESVLSAFSKPDTLPAEGFGTRWKARFFEGEQLHESFLAACTFSDLKVFEHILDYIPDGAILQMGNSSVVRYIQLFNQLRNVRYFGNRGVSGIEGCTSTAVGASQVVSGLTVLVSGDQAFRYDSNALAVKAGQENLRVIVINNGGGNIFRIIDGPTRYEMNEEFIEKRDEGSIQKLVEYHGVDYLKAADIASLDEALEDLLRPDRSTAAVLEVFTPRTESPEVLKHYFAHIRKG